ncbi:hypothetical protein EX30DRAFT_373309 [Ascodesmis nigricans]|uniref:TeaA receptor TeaR n=1 Tax=Ascodesmis nigricans TaxID=341454 RepID=A0A4S2MQ17_9PEZI|nr:hypothetical protein EX30DRAFT_373309 [Ascodesmis nigricans]
MATATHTLTPPSSSHGPKTLSGDWKFSVPLDPNDQTYGQGGNDYASGETTNGYRSDYDQDDYRDGSSNRGDYYGDKGASYRFTNTFSSNSAEYVHDSDPEASKWIHRDKLAQIEGNEAADYLYDVESSRWIHKDKLERIEIQELQRAGLGLPVLPSRSHRESTDRNASTHRIPSPTDFDDYNDMEIRRPEEIAAERIAYKRNGSSSRIPVAHSSAKPVPQEVLERTSPLPRNPPTPNGSEDGRGSIAYPAARKRSSSTDSSRVLDDASNTQSTPTSAAPKVSNPKTRASGAPGTGSKNTGARTGSMGPKARTRSNPQLHRPTTSASYSTGAPGKSPEGIPPWEINQTYKPDPRLPQDQQIIPTVAKRMQQEQWERDGVPASVYDRELRPLKVDASASAEVAAVRQSIQQEDGIEWPLQSPTATSQPSPKKEERAPTVSGGYTTMPPATKTPTLPTVESNPQPQIQRVPEGTNDEPKKSKMCCCVIM